MISFQPITLDRAMDDREAMLALRDGCLIAVLTRLSSMHGAFAGQWFVEAHFAMPPSIGATFPTLSAVETWLEA